MSEIRCAGLVFGTLLAYSCEVSSKSQVGPSRASSVRGPYRKLSFLKIFDALEFLFHFDLSITKRRIF